MSELHPIDAFIIRLTQGDVILLSDELRKANGRSVSNELVRGGQVVEVSDYDFSCHFGLADAGPPKFSGESPGIPVWYLYSADFGDYVLFWQTGARYFGRRLSLEQWEQFWQMLWQARRGGESEGDT